MTLAEMINVLTSIGISVFHNAADEGEHDAYIVWTLSPMGGFHASNKLQERFMRLWINLFDKEEFSIYDKRIYEVFETLDCCVINFDGIIPNVYTEHTKYVYSVQFVLRGGLVG